MSWFLLRSIVTASVSGCGSSKAVLVVLLMILLLLTGAVAASSNSSSSRYSDRADTQGPGWLMAVGAADADAAAF
jgi:cytochrome c biogenesis factor